MNGIKQLKDLHDNTTIVWQIQNVLQKVLIEELKIHEILLREIEVNPTQDDKFGDYTSNIALKLSKQLGKNPREIASTICQNFNYKYVEKCEVAGPGFVNFYLNTNFFKESLENVLHQNEKFGTWNLSNKKVMVEFGQPNTHKAFHVGHLKSAITGLAVAKLIENLGFRVIKANYFGDVGMHVAKCLWGYLEKTKDENFKNIILLQADPHDRMKLLDQCYSYGAQRFGEDKKVEQEIRAINVKIYSKEDPKINELYELTRTWSIEHQTDAFKKLGIVYDRQYPESEVYVSATELVTKNIGNIFIEDEGAIIFPGEKYNLNRWVFITQEGNPTYSAKDLGLAYKKFEEYPDLSLALYLTSVEQNAYFDAVFKALGLIEPAFEERLTHLGFGWLLRNNKKTSSRMGDSIKGVDIIEEAKTYSLEKIRATKDYSPVQANKIAEKVGVAGLKFLILSRELNTDINYDPEAFTNPEGFSGPYVLYGYVRAKSILREASNKFGQNKDLTKSLNSLDRSFDFMYPENINRIEITLLKQISKYPQVSLEAGRTVSPHLISYYLFELTQLFNQFYKENKVLVEDDITRNFRLHLVQATAIILKNGLNLLGIETIEHM